MKTEIITTDDNSKSLRNIELDETYHSSFGAIQESMHIFINAGLKQINKNEISILEIGFGTGLNALLTKAEMEQSKIDYTTIEKFPISIETAREINFESLIEHQNLEFELLHQLEWNKTEKWGKNFDITKLKADITIQNFGTNKYDLIYFDAFSPNKQPELWSEDIFDKIYKSMKTGAILTTYCCQGQVKRNMKAVGFTIEKLKGPPGKREFIRAVK